MKIRRVLFFQFLLAVTGGAIASPGSISETIPNWPAPAYWSPADVPRAARAAVHPLQVQAIIPGFFPFVPITPCRQFDIRPGTLADNTNLTIALSGAPCGIPSVAAAVSVNITVFSITGAIGDGALAVGIAANPPTSWITYPPTETQRANAGVVPTDGSGNIVVKVNQGGGSIQLTVDVNGYYAGAGTGTANTFVGRNAGNLTMNALFNTAIGDSAFSSNSTGNGNTVVGAIALTSNTTGNDNTACGVQALTSNISGGDNTACGHGALFSNTTGSFNTASGEGALFSNTSGNNNTASGVAALLNNTTGSFNTASGFEAARNSNGDSNIAIGTNALRGNIAPGNIGSGNVAVGINALLNNTLGNGNVGIGFNGGLSLTTGDNNIDIGNIGVAGEANTVRIGAAHTRAFIAGIRDVTTGMADAIPVLIDSQGQLGTLSSSARVKEGIEEMGEKSSGLLKLRPVTFRYKGQAGDRKQFGLIAEEVEEVLPELVVHNRAGEVETVLYHEMPAMLLNELQKQHRAIEAQRETIEEQREQIATLRKEKEEQIRALEGRLVALESRAREKKSED